LVYVAHLTLLFGCFVFGLVVQALWEVPFLKLGFYCVEKLLFSETPTSFVTQSMPCKQLSWYKSLFLQLFLAILAGGIKIYTDLEQFVPTTIITPLHHH